jgi:hypothetical protein
MIVSNLTLVGIRIMQFMGQAASGTFGSNENNEDHPDQEEGNRPLSHYKWEKSSELKVISYVMVLFMLPFFLTWTIIGNVWIV